jgi:hypothetical protein
VRKFFRWEEAVRLIADPEAGNPQTRYAAVKQVADLLDQLEKLLPEEGPNGSRKDPEKTRSL